MAREFRQEIVWESLVELYWEMVRERGLSLHATPQLRVNAYMRGKAMSAFFKRTLDLTVAAVGLVLLSPLLAAIAVVVRITMGRPVFFRQIRPGYHARRFTLVKFRTMTEADLRRRLKFRCRTADWTWHISSPS